MLNLIANELKSIGFETQVASIGVIVSLDREISQTEVETALNRIPDRVRFLISRISKNAFLIKE